LSRRSIPAVVAIVLTAAAGAAGCDTDSAAPVWVGPSSAPSTSANSADARPTQVISACGLLSSATVVELLGGTAASKISGREGAAEKGKNGAVWRRCLFGRDGRDAFLLDVGVLPGRAGTVKETVDAFAENAATGAKRIDGLGADALGYLDDDARVVVSVVPFRDELRVVLFTAPKIVPQNHLEKVVHHVVSQI
jgi:hypothetical protein